MKVLSFAVLGFLAFHVSALPQSHQDQNYYQRQQPSHRHEPNQIHRFVQGIQNHWNEWQRQDEVRNAEVENNKRIAGMRYPFNCVHRHDHLSLVL